MVTAGALMLLAATVAAADNDKTGTGEHKVVICHATSATTNPYTSNDVDVAGGWDGHDKHAGPVFSADLPKHTDWGDIIPETTYNGITFSLNWDAAGQAIWNNGCSVPGTPTETTTPPATETETTTPPATDTETTAPPTTETTTAPASSEVNGTSAAGSTSAGVEGVISSRPASSSDRAGAAVGPIPAGANAGLHAPVQREGPVIWVATALLIGGTAGLLLGLWPRRSRVH